ncbi:MAG: hypothetical protein GF416_08100 [Candidatus Altiarchaeales archaeon]|nr:hypothetical protein [Candidatus Altiarchaeales archaeon]MBD3417076.1 hypothetical protein [Candidatus Altiarchaeales archaeon]
MTLKPKDDTTRKHLTILLSANILAKLFLVLVLATVPVEDVGAFLGISYEYVSENWRVVGMEYDSRPLVDKLAYTFDSRWFVNIAGEGYVFRREDTPYLKPNNREMERAPCLYNWLFMYPAFIWTFANLMSVKAAALAVSNLASLAVIVLFYNIALEWLKPDDAFKATLLMALFPYNLTVWMTAYSEPLFLLFALISWMSYKRGRMGLAGVAVMFASFTRFPGMILYPIYTILYGWKNRRGGSRRLAGGLVSLNVYAAPILYWMYVKVPALTGYALTEITALCAGYKYVVLGGLVGTGAVAVLFTYFAFLAGYYLKGVDGELMLYSLAYLAFHMLVFGTGGSIGRYLGVIWPLFIYYGRALDRMDVAFFSSLFMFLAVIMIEFQANMVSWI